MTTISAIRFPQTRLVDPASAPPARTVAHDGWTARVRGEPRDVEGLTVGIAGEWLEGWYRADGAATVVLEIWRGEHPFDA